MLLLLFFFLSKSPGPSALQSTVADIYADDTTISYSTYYKVPPQAISLQSDLDRLQKSGSDNNKMTLSETKTKAVNVNGSRKE